jgi:hypothetical protein
VVSALEFARGTQLASVRVTSSGVNGRDSLALEAEILYKYRVPIYCRFAGLPVRILLATRFRKAILVLAKVEIYSPFVV